MKHTYIHTYIGGKNQRLPRRQNEQKNVKTNTARPVAASNNNIPTQIANTYLRVLRARARARARERETLSNTRSYTAKKTLCSLLPLCVTTAFSHRYLSSPIILLSSLPRTHAFFFQTFLLKYMPNHSITSYRLSYRHCTQWCYFFGFSRKFPNANMLFKSTSFQKSRY
jgi:hypothetical protein